MIGLRVLREIPIEVLPGILNGAYTVHGGVVRDAGGRIVSHLVTAGPADLLKSLVPGADTVASLVQSGQLYQLSASVEALQSSVTAVMHVAAAGALLSGVGLAVNAAGFGYMRKRFDVLSSSLDVIFRNLESHHLAIVKGAMQNLRHAEQAQDVDTRKAMLLDAKRDFQVSAHHYLDRMTHSVGQNSFDAMEDSYAVSFLGASLAASELGLHVIAASDFTEHVESWRDVSRKHVAHTVVGEKAEALLDPRAVHDLPAEDVVQILDFTEDSHRGWGWIDDLRRRAAATESRWRPSARTEVDPQHVSTANRLRRRSEVLGAQAAHFRYLAESELTAGAFSSECEVRLREMGLSAGYIALESL